MLRIAVIFFDDRGEHLLRRTAGGDIFLKIRELILHKFYPCRTAGGKKRQVLAFFKTFQEFCRLLHDRQVGRIAGVKNFIKSHAVQDCYDLAHRILTFWQSKGITGCHTHCRCDLGNNSGVFIFQCLPDFPDVGTDRDRTGRTEYTALSTVYTVCLCDLPVKCRHDHRIRSTVSKVNRSDSLDLIADTHTVSAQDTFIRVSYDRRGRKVKRSFFSGILETDFFHAEAVCQLLKYTFAALDTGRTVPAMCSQQKLYDQLAVFSYFF